MAPPQVKLNEKPPAETSQGGEVRALDSKKEALLSALTDRYNDVANDPLPEKKDGSEPSAAVIVTVDRSRRSCQLTAEQRRQRKRCRIACCASLSFLLVLLLALGTACLVYRMKHRKIFADSIASGIFNQENNDDKHWHSFCGTKDGIRVPENVHVNHDDRLIRVAPEHDDSHAMDMLHEYNRGLIAFKNNTAKTCYLDRLDETFEDGYARWQGYEEVVHKQNHTLRVFPEKINIQVVRHIADVHIFEHCGGEEVEYHWVMEVTEEEIRMHPENSYISV